MEITILISLCIFIVYVCTISNVFGIPDSISESAYLLEGKKKGLGNLFLGFCFGVSSMLPVWLELGDKLQFLPFLACSGLMFTGTAMWFKESMTKTVHFTGAMMAATCSVLWICLCTPYWYIPIASFGLFSIPALFGKKWTFWLEIASFISLYSTLLLTIL